MYLAGIERRSQAVSKIDTDSDREGRSARSREGRQQDISGRHSRAERKAIKFFVGRKVQ